MLKGEGASETTAPKCTKVAVHLSSTAKGLWEAMEEQLAELKQQRQGAAALAALWGMGCAQLRAATDLLFGATYGRPVSLAGGARCRRQRVCICYCIAEAAVGYALGTRRGLTLE